MHQYTILMFTLIMVMNYNEFSQTIVYADKNYSIDNFEPESSSVTQNIKKNAVAENMKDTRQHNHKQNFPNIISKNIANQENAINLCPYLDTSSTYFPTICKIVDYNNVDFVDSMRRQQQLQSLNNLRYQYVEDIYDSKTIKRSPLLKHLPKEYANFIYDPYQLLPKPTQTSMSSDDHLKTDSLAAHATPSPSNLEMHPNLHHHLPLIIYKKPTIVSHATSNEPSPMTTESIKSLTSIENMQSFFTTARDEKLIANNKLNDYDNAAKQVSNFNLPVPKAGSKQYLYAPLHSSLERELPNSSNFLPYPPSFIYITTTEKPLYNYKSVNNQVPDFFTQRQYKSLWDSYIPSWQITKMLQQFKNKYQAANKNDLQTLAFVKQNKKKIDK